jgi:hypothetical protein
MRSGETPVLAFAFAFAFALAFALAFAFAFAFLVVIPQGCAVALARLPLTS